MPPGCSRRSHAPSAWVGTAPGFLGLTTLELSAARLPPAWSEMGSMKYPLGTDDLGRDLLARLGNAQPTAATVALVVAWTVAEDGCLRECGYSSAFERNNPLNSTMPGYNAIGTIDGDGVKNYPTYEDGMQATIATISLGYYTEIVAGLRANDPERAFHGLINSPWAGSRYGGGTSFGQDWRGR